jgi:hypothetical protein
MVAVAVQVAAVPVRLKYITQDRLVVVQELVILVGAVAVEMLTMVLGLIPVTEVLAVLAL